MNDLLELGLASTGEPQRSRRGAIVVVLAALVLVAALVAGYTTVRGMVGKPPLRDFPGPGRGSVTLTIDPDSSLGEIARLLVEKGIVATRTAFLDAAAANPKAATLAPGTYEFLLEMRAADAVDRLIGNAHRLRLHVVIPEGFEVAQVLAAIAAGNTNSNLNAPTKDDLLLAAKNASALGLPSYANGQLEGFLFPVTYDFDPGTTAAQALAVMVKQFKQEAADVDLVAKSTELKMSPYDVLKIASIVEREGKTPDDYAKIARVIYNRLAKDMPLQMDSTLQYKLGKRKAALTLKDIANPSPYNSYAHKGLPPTPISNPGDASLQAALAPQDGDWLYFVAFKDGTTKFTNSYKEFVKLKTAAGLTVLAK